MYSLKKSFLFGFLVWLVPFAVAFLIYPMHESNRPFFESIMPVAITLSVVLFTFLYFKNVEKDMRGEGVKLGLIFLFMSLVIDLILFMPESPMHMSFPDYLADIGVTYLMIPVLTVGMAYTIDRERNKK